MTDPMTRKRILLHSCCGPCSTAVTERLAEDYRITVFYYNPNITDPEEYEHRKAEQKRFLSEYSAKTGNVIDFMEGDYAPEEYYKETAGHEQDPEGGERCSICFHMRLLETALTAKKLGFDCFDTTLTVSPYKNSKVIIPMGEAIAEETGTVFIGGNYKKKDGYKRSCDLSREYGLYRQHYCGCEFSKWEPEAQ